MSPDVPHTDIGAYALGLLEPDDRRRVEAHVAHCPPCRAELPELSRIATALRAVPPDLAPTSAEATVGHDPPQQLIDLARRRAADDRRRRRRDLLLAAAVGVVVLAGGVVVGGGVVGGQDPADSAAVDTTDDTATDDLDGALPGAAPEPLPLSATDPVTGTSGTVTMEATSWGTSVGLRLANVRGPLECELVAVTTTGERVVSSWSVPDSGYGVEGASDPLTLEGSVASSPDDISRFDVRTSDGQTLLSVPT